MQIEVAKMMKMDNEKLLGKESRRNLLPQSGSSF